MVGLTVEQVEPSQANVASQDGAAHLELATDGLVQHIVDDSEIFRLQLRRCEGFLFVRFLALRHS